MRGVDSFVAVKAQTDLTTPATLSTYAEGDFLAFNNESLSGRQNTYESPAIRQSAMRPIAYTANGTVAAEGSIEFTASNHVLNTLLPLIFHDGAVTGTAVDSADGAGLTYTLVGGGELTPFTTLVGFDGPEGRYARQFVGSKINRATFSARVDSMLTVATDVVAIRKDILTGAQLTAGSFPEAPAYPDAEDEYAYLFSEASVHFRAGDMADYGEVPVESIDLTINHNLATDRYRLGSVYRRSLQESLTDVEGTFTLDMAAQALSGSKFDLAGGGADVPTFWEAVAASNLYAALQFKVKHPTLQVGTDPYYDCEFVITLPYVRIEEPDFNVRDGGMITGTARFRGYESITAKHVALLTIP